MSWLIGQQLAAYNGAHMAALSDKYEEVYIRNFFSDQLQVLWTAGCECSESLLLLHINVFNLWSCYRMRISVEKFYNNG